jgi:hypothetical protein
MSEDKKLKMAATGTVEDTDDGKFKVVFAPGCFDHLDVESQEELDALMAEIQDVFANLTPEQLEAQSRPITDEDIDAMDPMEREILLKALDDVDSNERKSRLQ